VNAWDASAEVTRGEARARDGTRIAYTLHERDDNECRAVLIHSLGMDRHFWEPVVQRLLQDGAILVYDCRGHGESGKPAGPYSMELFSDDLAVLLDQVGWRSALIAGASMGGCVALQFAADHPHRATALGLVDTTAWYGASAPKDWSERANRALESGLRGMIEFQTTRWFSDAFRARHPHAVQRCVDTFLRNDVQAFAAACRMLGAFDGRALLAGLSVPASILVGEEDYATPPAMAEALHRAIDGSALTVIPGARHLTPVEEPDAVARELRRLMVETRHR
jgi:3-oxoadipate enol-lactonase